MEELKEELKDFITWLEDCGEDAFYVFSDTEDAIEKYFEQKED